MSAATRSSLLAAGLGLLLSLPAVAEEPNAQQLYQENCVKCHGSEVYTRPDRKIHSLDALKGQVRMCEQNLGLTWFDDQINSVAALLNKEYYKFAD